MFKSIAFACALVIGAATAVAADAPAAPAPAPAAASVAPDIFVLSIYHTKLESEAASPEMGRAMNDSQILNHFTAELLALYKSTYYVDEPIIDGDVFMMAQDWDTKEVATKTTAQTADAATVEASFKIAGEARTVTYTLKAARGGWEIDDVASNGTSLRKIIAEGMTGR